ncbi:MAG: vitamin K epoxide reductase family protein [Chloroherpetonaceae bacterium]|nr:vitamin K epoxide reductase family protein [Chthonomonadaceae bacterium]MDW8208195.1 vitamin K epoxide reductase family protein [Chloroherpetonaceae bacterium]
MSKALSNLFTLIIAATGVPVTLILTYLHFNPEQSVGCTAGPTGCQGVLQSQYGHLGPIPTSLIGLGMYLIFIGLCLQRRNLLNAWRAEEAARATAYAAAVEPVDATARDEGTASSSQNLERTAPSTLPRQIRMLDMAVWGVALIGFLISWWLQYKAIFEIGAICPWCLTSALLVTMIFGLASHDFLLEGRPLQGEQKMLAGVSVFVLILAGIIGWPQLQEQLGKIRETTRRQKFMMGKDMREALIDRNMHIKGDPNSPVVVIEFADYQCPACREAFQMVQEYMRKDPKRFRLAFRHFPLAIASHPWARHAARAAEAAGKQGKFWEMHEYLFTNQDRMKEPNFSPERFADFARAIGLNVDRFNRDFASQEVEERVENDVMAGKVARVESTPTFFFVTRTTILMIRGQDAFKSVMDDPKHPVWQKAAAGQ